MKKSKSTARTATCTKGNKKNFPIPTNTPNNDGDTKVCKKTKTKTKEIYLQKEKKESMI